MKRNIKLYDKTKTYVYPNGTLATPEDVLRDYPAAALFPYVIETDAEETMLMSFDNFSMLKQMHGIDPALPQEEALAALSAKLNEPPIPPEPTAEERIAAAMEFQNYMNL